MSGQGNGNGNGDALLAAGTANAPQTFTGVNKFDALTKFQTTRPQLIAPNATSNPTNLDFITKTDGVDLFATITGTAQLSGGVSLAEPQTFTGFNKFNNTTKFTNTIRVGEGTGSNDDPEILMTAPAGYANLIQQNSTRTSGVGSSNRILQAANQTNEITQQSTGNGINKFVQIGANSSITSDGNFITAKAPTQGSHLCNKTYVDGGRKSSLTQRSSANPVLSYVVNTGNPTAASGGDNLNGRMDTPNSGLAAEILAPSNAFIRIDFSIFGEWSADGWDKGIIIARETKQANGSYAANILIRADADASATNAIRTIMIFTNNYTTDANTTPETCCSFVIDVATVAGSIYRYTPVLVNAGNQVAHTFKLNRAFTNSNLSFAERGMSSITATILNV